MCAPFRHKDATCTAKQLTSGAVQFNATSPGGKSFTTCYGIDGTGDVYKNENIRNFAQQVERQTEGLGVQLMVADGGDSVDGEFLRQEWLMRRLALCQAAVALQILRKGGDFFCKIFDTFTPFLHDLLFLLSEVFDKMAVMKPLTSRPANSERYIICMGLRERRPPLAEYLLLVNESLDDDEAAAMKRGNLYVHRLLRPELVPASWTDYLRGMNLRIGEAQVHALEETMRFYEDYILNISEEQNKLAKELVARWGVPETIEKSREMLRLATSRMPTAVDGSSMFTFDPVRDQPVAVQPNRSTLQASAQMSASSGFPHAEHHGPGGATAFAGSASSNAASVNGTAGAAGKTGASSSPANAPPKKTGPDLNSASVMEALLKRAAAAQAAAAKEKEESQQRDLQEEKKHVQPSIAAAKLGVNKNSKDSNKTKKKDSQGAKSADVEVKIEGTKKTVHGNVGADLRDQKEHKVLGTVPKKRSRDEGVSRNGEDGNEGKRKSKKKKTDDQVVGDEALQELERHGR
jgi:hypothetical protein